MNAFPSISLPSSFSQERRKSTIRTTFENGSVGQRAKWTSGKLTLELSWEMLSDADKVTLDTFFETNNGSAIQYTHPKTSTVHAVIFGEDTLKFDSLQAFDSTGTAMWATKIILLEI
jgi:hypothetical protein